MIVIMIPTVDGRGEHLARCVRAYVDVTEHPHCFIVVQNKPTCGEAWQEMVETALKTDDIEYLHWTADDLTPERGWDKAAIDIVEHGCVPAPVIYRSDGTFESSGGTTMLVPDYTDAPNITAIPFCSLDQWYAIGPHLPIHYYSDNWFTYRTKRAGYRVIVRHAYAFKHWWAQEGRGAGMTEPERMAHDRKLFEEAVRIDEENDRVVGFLELWRQQGAQWLDPKNGHVLPMGDPKELPWCTTHGYLDWRRFGYKLVVPDGVDIKDGVKTKRWKEVAT